MIFCKELNKEFSNKTEMLKALKENLSKIIELKKATITESKSNPIKMNHTKAVDVNKALELKESEVAAIINTTMYMDSHSDVHAHGIWEKSISEQYGRIFYVLDHSLDIDKVIVWRSDLVMYTKTVDWQTVGKNYNGQTQALIFKFDKSAIRNDTARKIIEENLDVENSVRMQYVNIQLAVDSTEEDYKENKAIWDSTINDIANKEEAIENGYFWLVKEAKIINEGSMVLFGSNDATSTVSDNKNIEPSADTQTKEEVAESSHQITTETETLSIYNFN